MSNNPSGQQPDSAPQTQLTNFKNPDLAPFWLAAIIDSADDAIISKTLEGVITSWNAGAERIFGYKAEEVIGKSVTILIPDGHRDEEPAILERIKAGERIEHYETVRVKNDGQLIDISLTVSPIRGVGGKIIGASKIARDITQRRKARKILDETAARLNLVLAASQLGDWSWDATTDVVTLSETAANIFGIPPGPYMTSTELRKWIDEKDRNLVEVSLDTAINDHSDFDLEYRLRRRDDSEIWVASKGRGLYSPEGTFLGMLGVIQDISNRKATEQTLIDQAEALQTLNEVGRIISAELDLHRTVQAVTDAATELTGAQFGSFFYNVLNEKGASYMLYAIAGAPREAFEHFRMPRATDLFPPTFKGEGVVRIPDVKLDPRYGKNSPYFGVPEGHLPVTSYLAVPVVSRSGEVLGGLFFGHPDANVFTERDERTVQNLASQATVAMDNARLYEKAERARAEAEHAASENERLYRQAEESSRLKEEFLATISHELRTPLNAILGWARLLRLGQVTGDNAAKALDTIERNARAQAQLIEDLLDTSRIITGKLRMDVRPSDPHTFINAAVDAIKPAADAKGVHIEKIIDTGAGSIQGDPVRLQQIVWNLLSNAIKFTPRGGRVQLRLERVESHIEMVVSDTGQGINQEFLPYVFDRFRQADQKTSRQHGGMGLGLAIVRHLVELHGGNVKAISDGEGQGATFTVCLPIMPIYKNGPSGERVHPAAIDLLPNAQSTERLDGLKVLVVDDEADTRDLLKQGLEHCGAQVTVAGSAKEALEAIGLKIPDVLISDIGMPVEDGYELIRQVRTLPPENGGRVPAIALTAYTRAEDRMQALRNGYHMHVGKPVELAELVAVAASLIRRNH